MKKIIVALFLFVFMGCSEVQHECIVVDKYRTFSKYGTPYSFLILKDKRTGHIYEECVSADTYVTPVGGFVTITKME